MGKIEAEAQYIVVHQTLRFQPGML